MASKLVTLIRSDFTLVIFTLVHDSLLATFLLAHDYALGDMTL
jgi:hypothetical protein